jgi:putative membrane protein
MIKNILKGAVMGVANIIPGVSGGTMAVSMGIYDKLIYALTHLRKEFKKSIQFLIPILLGAVIAIVALSFVIEWLFDHYPLQTNFLFIGLIIGGLPAILKKVKGKKPTGGMIVAFLLFFAIVVGMACTGVSESSSGSGADVSFSIVNLFVLFGVGIIAAATMVIPGVSGSMILMLLGFYEPIISSISDFVRALTKFDVAGIAAGCGTLIPFGLGCVIGIFAIAKGIEIIFERWPMLAYYAIIGLIVASPVAILIMSEATVTVSAALVSVVTFVIGGLCAYKLSE